MCPAVLHECRISHCKCVSAINSKSFFIVRERKQQPCLTFRSYSQTNLTKGSCYAKWN